MTTSHAAAVPEAQLPPLTEGPHRKRIGLISIVACLGGLLFGYDTGVSNGAEGPMAKELGLSLLQLGVVISSLIFAAAVGALIGGQISDRIGRRKTIIVLAVMFFVGVLFVVFSPGFEILVAGRIILGLAVGGASTVVPVYLAELAPYEIRGSITGRNELAIVLGQFLAFVVNAILGNTLGDHIEGVWRIMFGICALPAVALFVGMLRMPESPRWLVEKGRDDEALAVLKTVRSEDRALAELAQVEQVTEDEKKGNQLGFKEILANKWLRRIVFVGIGVSMTQQLTGINSIMYYGSRVLEESGFTEAKALIANTVFGLAAVIGGIFALRNMDRMDRRKTFFIGLFLTTICHCITGIAGMLIPEGNPARPYVIAVLESWPVRSTSPRASTSSTCTRCPTATAATARRASPSLLRTERQGVSDRLVADQPVAAYERESDQGDHREQQERNGRLVDQTADRDGDDQAAEVARKPQQGRRTRDGPC